MNIIIQKNFMEQHQQDKFGFATLFSLLVVSAISLTIAISVIISGVGTIKSARSLETSAEARALANACAEEALQMIRDLETYSGTDTIILGNGSCTYIVNNLGGESRSISASGISGESIRKVNVLINAINPVIQISSWQEGL